MAELNELREQLQQALIKIQATEERQRMYEDQMANLNDNLNENTTISGEDENQMTNLNNNFNQNLVSTTAEEDEDIETEITSGDQIQLDSYKSIPQFSGLKGTYRSWRNQVVRRMKMIHKFKTHPKYEAALGIFRSKITGPASNVLINNKTAYNIIAIIKTLDSSYMDRRPLYVVEAEMTSMKQLNKSLQEFHDVINEALHMVISKIVLDYRVDEEQRSLVTEAKKKAVRTFVVGLNNQMMRHILYSRTPGTLAEAFAIAQTVHYDHKYTESQGYYARSQQKQNSVQSANVNKTENLTTNEKKRENWRQQNPQQSRINQIQDELSEEHQIIPDDLISISSHESTDVTSETLTSSAFLDE